MYINVLLLKLYFFNKKLFCFQYWLTACRYTSSLTIKLSKITKKEIKINDIKGRLVVEVEN